MLLIIGNDNIFKGLSTFAVEMLELNNILKFCDENSLILGDELCSGTENDSAIGIILSGIDHMYNKKKNYDMLKKHDTMYKYKLLWDKINRLDPFTKRCIYLKYNYQFDKIRSNKQVSLLMCCSEENIRTKLKNINKTFID